MGRIILILASMVPLLLISADTVLWRIAVGRLEAGFDDWVAGARRSGLTVTRASAVSGGWPWAATLELNNVIIQGGNTQASTGGNWHSELLVLSVPLIRPYNLDIEARGRQLLRIGTMPDIVITGARLRGVTGLGSSDGGRALDLQADHPRLSSRTNAGQPWDLTAASLQINLRLPSSQQTPAQPAEFSFRADAIVLPPIQRWPLGNDITSLAVEGAVEGAVPSAQAPHAWAVAWRDGGGSVSLRNAMISWGMLRLTFAATLALDDQLQPMGAGTSRINGYGPALEALGNNGTLSRSAVTAATAVLSLLAGSQAPGDTPEVEVPLTLQFRTLSMRQVPLLRLPELDWTDP